MSAGELHAVDEEEIDELIDRLRDRATEAKREEVEYALDRLELSAEEERVVRQMADCILERLLEPPVSRLREADEEGGEVAETAKELFGISVASASDS